MVGRNAQQAIAALVVLAQSDRRISSIEIAASTNISTPSMSKTLNLLRQGGYIVSIPGPGGGFTLTRQASEITVLEICKYFDHQAVGPKACAIVCGCTEATPCAIHSALQVVKQLKEKTLSDITIDNLSAA